MSSLYEDVSSSDENFITGNNSEEDDINDQQMFTPETEASKQNRRVYVNVTNVNVPNKIVMNANNTNLLHTYSNGNENSNIVKSGGANNEDWGKEEVLVNKVISKNNTSNHSAFFESGHTKDFRPPSKLSEFREVHDLTRLNCITLENVLECLRERYRSDIYYTYAGPVLLSLNSCLKVPRASIVEDVTKMTWFFFDDTSDPNKENETEGKQKAPHVYDVGRQCLRNVVTVGSHQIILISGESGAGKTTATQQLIKYLTENNSRNFGANICSNLDKKIYFATLILESFGNAKTQANPNSSRFGRLVQLNYDKHCGRITGAEIQTYLLEKHRIAKYDFNCERTFHILYYILLGIKNQSLVLSDVPQKDCWNTVKELIPGHLSMQALECEEDELQRFLNAIQAFNMTNDFSELVSILFALIIILKVTFVPDCDSSSDDDYCSGRESSCKTEFTVSDWNCAKLAARLLGVKESELVDILIARKITAGGSRRHSIFRKPCEQTSECEERLHALASFIYDRIFSYILESLNTTLKGITHGASSNQSLESLSTLSLLDLYGFENFYVNHLEQICINYANERLQQVNVSIMKSYHDQSQCLDEICIPPTELIRIENELIQRIDELNQHIFAFFDEECLLKRSSENKDLLERMSMSTKKSKFITTGKLHEGYKFTISHYATKVDYELNGIVQKNKDHIPPEFQDVLKSSSNTFICNLFKYELVRSRNLSGQTTPRSANNKNSRGKTILTRFKSSVEELMERLKVSENKDVHFIRCIRPNATLQAGSFSMNIVENQLHACGIADVVKIAGNGYPIRVHTSKFVKEFPRVVAYYCGGKLDSKIIELIFSTTNKQASMKFGKTMVFMSEKCWKKIRKTEKQLIVCCAKVIQRAWKTHLKRIELLKDSVQSNTMYLSSLDTSNIVSGIDMEISYDSAFDSKEVSQISIGIGAFGDAGEDVNYNLSTSVNQQFTTSDSDLEMESVVQKCRPLLYNALGIASRAPVHTLPIKFYTKKTCLTFAEKPPRRLIANGLADAFEDYGIIFYQT